MNQRPRLVTFSPPLLLICCFLCVPSPGYERGAGQSSADLAQANNSFGHQEIAQQPSQAADAQPPAKDSDPLFPIVEHGKWGYMDKAGKIVISPEYYDAVPFKEGLARIQPWPVLLSKAIRVYFIDKNGQILNMSKIYSDAQDFSEGLALVAVPGERGVGYIDTTGKMVIPQDDSHEEAGSFREGLARIKQGGKWGYIDKLGQTVVGPKYDDVLSFSGGLAPVKLDKKWGFIDHGGKMVIAPQYDLAYMYTEGLAAVKLGGKWGYIDPTGKIVVPLQFSDAYGLSEGLAQVKDGSKWGYINKAGQMIIQPAYDMARKHSAGLAPVKTNGKWGYIDNAGKMVILPEYDEAYVFLEGLAPVRVGKKFGYIDKTGKYVWTPTK